MNATMETEVCRNVTERWIDKNLNPRKTIDIVEVCMIITVVFIPVLAGISHRRRKSKSTIINHGAKGVFTLSYLLIPYTMGLMGGKAVQSELYPVWAMFFAMILGGTNELPVQQLDETKHLMRLNCKNVLICVYLGSCSVTLFTVNNDSIYIWLIYSTLCLLVGMKLGEQSVAARLASKPSLMNGIKWLALYMKREQQLSTSYDTHTMKGYKYAVLIHGVRGGIEGIPGVTLEEIWCDNIGVFSNTNSPHISGLKDLCLSFSLFHLVVRRYFGYACSESEVQKTRDLVHDGLLGTETGYERAFQVIEAELAFLYDFFFTKYAYILYGREVLCHGNSFVLTFLSIAMGVWSLSNTHRSIMDDLLVETNTRDIVVTTIILGALSIFQMLQVWTYCSSDWAKISFVCKYIRRPMWQQNDLIGKLLLLMGRPHRSLHYWSNNIGQYSALDFFSSSYLDRFVHLFQSRKAGKPIELPMEVKNAVAKSIKNSIANGHLSNGASLLTRHRMSDELFWECHIGDQCKLTCSILVWHIATSYCELSKMANRPYENYVHRNQVVATSLSKYCAYLVSFTPRLLPDSPAEIECMLDELVDEAKETLQNLALPSEKYEKLSQVHYRHDETTSAQLLSKGVILGKSLEDQPTSWDLLADFWAEMMVYMAPSDNVEGHIELLAEGGEFVTHVWALLMHAGILDRPAAGAATAVP